jgi:hypothetical protein
MTCELARATAHSDSSDIASTVLPAVAWAFCPGSSRVWTFAGAARLGLRRLDAAFARSDADKTIMGFRIEHVKVPDEFEVVWVT